MEQRTRFSLKTFNTFGVDALAAHYVRFDAEAEIRDYMGHCSPDPGACLILGGGSNLLFTGDIDGTVLHPAFKGIDVLDTSGGQVTVRAMAGETWDDLVAASVENGWGGVENLSAIPGSVGACAVQNIGAYGVEVGTRIDHVRAIDLATGETVALPADACGFGYRSSRFKGRWAGRFLITAVVFQLSRRPRFMLDYPGVREAVAALGAVNLRTVRQAIIDIRRRKLPDPAVTGNAGSFFKNPVVGAGVLARLRARHPDLPHYPQADGRFKLAAGWLIDRCGWKGRHLGSAGVHDRQALVLVNRGRATGREILALAGKIHDSVEAAFGIDLEREVTVVGGP